MDKQTADTLIQSMIQSADGVSDLLFISGRPPMIEVKGRLREFPIETADGGLLTPALIGELTGHITGNEPRLEQDFEAAGACDCNYSIPGIARFRANIYKEGGRRAMVMRKLPSKIPTFEDVSAPPVFREIIREKNGVVLVTGATGSGKTTTLAAMINELNMTQEIHIVTLEDPIEFAHPPAKAAMSHRELGRDFRTFAEGLRAALRQAPKVILVGEIRDRATMEIAMTAAETGHLVFSTLHTINASQTVHRILGFFTSDEEQQVRERLAGTLRYIVSQRLVEGKTGDRLLMTEVMGSNLRTREAIRYGEGDNRSLNEIIEAASPQGWHSFDQSLLKAREADLISDETTLSFANDKPKVIRALDLLAKQANETFKAPSGLKMDRPAPVVMPANLSR